MPLLCADASSSSSLDKNHNDHPSSFTITDLPYELLLTIFEYCIRLPYDLSHLASVCRDFRSLLRTGKHSHILDETKRRCFQTGFETYLWPRAKRCVRQCLSGEGCWCGGLGSRYLEADGFFVSVPETMAEWVGSVGRVRSLEAFERLHQGWSSSSKEEDGQEEDDGHQHHQHNLDIAFGVAQSEILDILSLSSWERPNISDSSINSRLEFVLCISLLGLFSLFFFGATRSLGLLFLPLILLAFRSALLDQQQQRRQRGGGGRGRDRGINKAGRRGLLHAVVHFVGLMHIRGLDGHGGGVNGLPRALGLARKEIWRAVLWIAGLSTVAALCLARAWWFPYFVRCGSRCEWSWSSLRGCCSVVVLQNDLLMQTEVGGAGVVEDTIDRVHDSLEIGFVAGSIFVCFFSGALRMWPMANILKRSSRGLILQGLYAFGMAMLNSAYIGLVMGTISRDPPRVLYWRPIVYRIAPVVVAIDGILWTYFRGSLSGGLVRVLPFVLVWWFYHLRLPYCWFVVLVVGLGWWKWRARWVARFCWEFVGEFVGWVFRIWEALLFDYHHCPPP